MEAKEMWINVAKVVGIVWFCFSFGYLADSLYIQAYKKVYQRKMNKVVNNG